MRSHRVKKRILNVNHNIFIILIIIFIIIIGISGNQWYRPHAVAYNRIKEQMTPSQK